MLYVGVRNYLRTAPVAIAQNLRTSILLIAILVLLFLSATGRLAPLLALLGAGIAFLLRLMPYLIRYLPLFQQLWSRRTASAGPYTTGRSDRSTVNARFVRMHLDHLTGEVSGEVLKGAFAGKRLKELSLDELVNLYAECKASDNQSAALVQAYLDRVYGEAWHTASDSNRRRPDEGRMKREEALEVLGLSPQASKREIIEAHRRLIQKLHPDRGGSDYLAAKINQAKTILLSR